MSVTEETLEMITSAIKSGSNVHGMLVRSKLTNRLVWKGKEHDENDPYNEYLAIIGADRQPAQAAFAKERVVLGESQAHGQSSKATTSLGEKALPTRKNVKHDKENWQDDWEMLKKAGQYCSFCKSNREAREIYLSHNLKGPNDEVTCPVLLKCVCQCCGKQGHTIAYCPENQSGTSILKMMNRHNRF